MEGVCKIYEEHLKRLNPNTPSITYDISQLFDFIDQLADLSCLVYVQLFYFITCHTHDDLYFFFFQVPENKQYLCSLQ